MTRWNKTIPAPLNATRQRTFSEFEKDANAIIVNFGVQNQAILDILTGVAEPSGLLPYQMPADMKTVEEQSEDIPHDMICYSDEDGHLYDFGFGLNWNGIINDARTRKYLQIPKPEIHVKGDIVTLTSKIQGVDLYFTTDGTNPGFFKNQLYTRPFTVKKGDVVKAIAKRFDFDNSSMTVYNYQGQ